MTSLEKTFNPHAIEAELYLQWVQAGAFKPSRVGTPFSMVAPPPNVTGILHMGHALNLSLQDIMARYKRMKGFDVLWIPGTDHAGIATQNVVERQLAKEENNRFQLGRKAFVDRVWTWKEEYGNRITSQIRKLGASVDWDYERFTMDAACSKAVTTVFIDLFEKGLIYRGRYLINWCPRCKTALSDIEVLHEDHKGSLWHIRYPFSHDSSQGIVVATTRPETMFGDTAIAVNPKDSRYQHLIGKTVTIPFTQKAIPIIADAYVDMEFGTGALKITPAHDFNDFEIGKRHNLEQVMVIDEEGKLNSEVPTPFIGLDRFVARKKLVLELQEKGYLVKIAEHALSIGKCYRCHTIVEPYFSLQWFVNMKALAPAAIEAVQVQHIQLIPKRWEKLYFEWMGSIKDWCISRQIWWGHQIPVWYCSNHPDEPIASKVPLTKCPKCGSADIKQDEDVLDTWFSSALWPFETLGWPEATADLERYYPTSLLITGYDILTFWVSRMITMGLAQTQTVPFEKVYIHGLVRDISGKKMSKSLGNALDPLELIEKYGTDALRFALAQLTTMGGQDIKLSEDKIESARNFVNKIWNSARYILMIIQESAPTQTATLSMADQWILSVYHSTLAKIDEAYNNHHFALIADLLWDFCWNQFCDWYIEMSKIEKEKSLPILLYILTNMLKLLHPFMPFLTESLWQHFRQIPSLNLNESSFCMKAAWPVCDQHHIQPEIESDMALLISVIREIRNLRKQANIAPKIECRCLIVAADSQVKATLQKGMLYLQKLAKLSEAQILDNLDEKPAQSSAGIVGDIQVFLLLEGLIDVEKERQRLQKQAQALQLELDRIEAKLNNSGFLNQAPPAVIEKIKLQKETLLEEQRLVSIQLEEK